MKGVFYITWTFKKYHKKNVTEEIRNMYNVKHKKTFKYLKKTRKLFPMGAINNSNVGEYLPPQGDTAMETVDQ